MTKEIPKRRAGHYYLKGIDKPLPSVTKILEVLAKPGLIYWAAQTAAKAALADPSISLEEAVSTITCVKNKAGDEGKKAHELIDFILKGGTVEKTDDKVQCYLNAYYKFVDTFKPEYLFTEAIVVNEKEGYAGQLDAIAKDKDGNTWLLDYKTNNAIYPEMGLQLSAYKNAEKILEKEEFVAIPKIDYCGIVHLKNDGTFSLVEMDEPFDVFLALKKTHEWKDKN